MQCGSVNEGALYVKPDAKKALNVVLPSKDDLMEVVIFDKMLKVGTLSASPGWSVNGLKAKAIDPVHA